MALIIKTDGTITEIPKGDARLNNLSWLQEQVGGYLEGFTFRAPVDVHGNPFDAMMLNEEGKLKGLALNPIATKIARAGGLAADVIVGDVIVFVNGEID